jgi:hypothetical protein
MTADDIFNTTIALMFAETTEKADYQTQFIAMMNLLLAETFDVNNSIRVSKGLVELENIPTITVATLNVEMTYDDVVCRRILPYGAAGMLMAENDASMAVQYKNKYEYEKANSYKAVYTQIVDVYAEEE